MIIIINNSNIADIANNERGEKDMAYEPTGATNMIFLPLY